MPTGGRGVLVTAGYAPLKANGKWALFDGSGNACECCEPDPCIAYISYPENLTETFPSSAGMDSRWVKGGNYSVSGYFRYGGAGQGTLTITWYAAPRCLTTSITYTLDHMRPTSDGTSSSFFGLATGLALLYPSESRVASTQTPSGSSQLHYLCGSSSQTVTVGGDILVDIEHYGILDLGGLSQEWGIKADGTIMASQTRALDSDDHERIQCTGAWSGVGRNDLGESPSFPADRGPQISDWVLTTTK